MAKLDRRIVRTRKALADALIGLANEKGYDNITIRDLTQRANIGYATFYRHYKSKDELVTDFFRGIIQEIEREIRPEMTHYEESLAMFRTVRKYGDAILFSTSLPRDHPAIKPLWEETTELVYTLYAARDESIIPMEVSVNHIITSVVELFRWWLLEGQEYSIEQMAIMQSELIIKVTEEVALAHRRKSLRVLAPSGL